MSRLIHAIERNDIKEVKKLVEQGADIYTSPWSALDVAAQNGRLEILDYLISNGADIHRGADAALRHAVWKGQFAAVKYLVKHGADVDAMIGEPLAEAATAGNLDIVKYLVKKGADINIRNGNALYWAIRKGQLHVVKYLLDRVKIPEQRFREAVNYAVSDGKIDTVKYLISQGLDPAKNNLIKEAAYYDQDEIVAFLFQDPRVRDAGLPLPDPDSKNPLARALARILRWNIVRQQQISQEIHKRKSLAEEHLISHILSYHPLHLKKKKR